jgi:hypothetical protein
MSNGCAPVLASYSAINLFTSSMSAVADHIREELYRREMKMSEFWRSCSVSCGTSRFGLLWNRIGGFESLHVILPPFPGRVKMAFLRCILRTSLRPFFTVVPWNMT